MFFFKELHCKLRLQFHGAKSDSSDVKEHFHTFITSRDNCHNCQNPVANNLKL